jgi:hypothetical protein
LHESRSIQGRQRLCEGTPEDHLDDQIFSDGIGTITVIGGTVRLDFMSLSPTERDANGQPRPVFRQRIIMSVDGFLRSSAKVQEAVQALSKISGMQQQVVSQPGPVSVRTESPDVEGTQPAKTPAPPKADTSKVPFP